MSEELDEFASEVRDMLDSAEQLILKMTSSEAFQTSYTPVFRVFHNVKGAAGLIDYPELQEHMHRLEEVFVECQKTGEFGPPHLEYFLCGLDRARRLIRERETPDFRAAAPDAPDADAPAAPMPVTAQEPARAPSREPSRLRDTTATELLIEMYGELDRRLEAEGETERRVALRERLILWLEGRSKGAAQEAA